LLALSLFLFLFLSLLGMTINADAPCHQRANPHPCNRCHIAHQVKSERKVVAGVAVLVLVLALMVVVVVVVMI